MPNPLFSVVIPAYNAEPFLKQAIECISKQTFTDFEVVIVDNGSKDNTYKVAKDLLKNSKLNHQIVTVKDNVGIGPGRNLGIKAAKGKYISLLDADDIWKPNKLELVNKVFKQNPDVSLVCHDEDLYVDGKKTGVMKYGPYKKDMYMNLLLNGNCLSGSATTVSKDKLMKVGMFSSNLDFNGVEDYELWLRLAKICKFYFLHEILGEYRITASSASRNVEKQVQTEMNVVNYNVSLLKEQRSIIDTRLLDFRFALIYQRTGWSLHRQGKFKEAREYYYKAIETKPMIKSYIAIPLTYLGIKW